MAYGFFMLRSAISRQPSAFLKAVCGIAWAVLVNCAYFAHNIDYYDEKLRSMPGFFIKLWK